jgi:hypothetical protein
MEFDKKSVFGGLIKVCEIVGKITTEPIIVSEGTFSWMAEGALAVVLLSPKVEKEVTPFLTGKYEFDPKLPIFMMKYFQFQDIEFTDIGVRLTFTGALSPEALDDKMLIKYMEQIDQPEKGTFVIHIRHIGDNHNLMNRIQGILTRVGETADFDASVIVDDLDKNMIMKGDTPLDVEKGPYRIRASKSIFQSVNASDSIALRFTPYRNDPSTFLCTATVSKPTCMLINVFNGLHL